MVRFLRQLIFLVHALILRWAIWLVIWIIGRSGTLKTVFLIYPTDRAECLDFCPDNPILRKFFSCRPTPAGLIMDGWIPIGIYLIIPDQAMELSRKKNRPMAEKIIRRMIWIQNLSGAQTIGLAGQLGPIFEKRHGIPMDPPFYSSTFGNVFSIQQATNHLITTKNIKPWQFSISIIGGGELGEQLKKQLGIGGLHLEMIDVRYTRKGQVRITNQVQAKQQLSKSKIVINLLPRGEDFTGCNLHQITPSTATIIDFSRPQIAADTIDQEVVMGNRVQRSGLHFFMKLPNGWQRHELPACCMPSLLASLGEQPIQTQEGFYEAARQFAFHTAVTGTPALTNSSLRKKVRGLINEFPIALQLFFLTIRKRLTAAELE